MKNNLVLFKPGMKIEEIKENPEEICIDFEIPFDEIPYWQTIISFGKAYLMKQFQRTGDNKYMEYQKALEELSEDIEIYKNIELLVDKLSFLINLYEIYIISIIMKEFKKNKISKLYGRKNEYYSRRIAYGLNKYKRLVPLLEKSEN